MHYLHSDKPKIILTILCMLLHQSGTAGGIRTKHGVGPPHVPGRVLGYPDPGIILSSLVVNSSGDLDSEHLNSRLFDSRMYYLYGVESDMLS